MNFKDDVICNICKKFLNDPISLPCGCWICNEHVLTKNNNTIKCLYCNEEFPKSKRFKPNETAKKIINSDSHLTREQKSSKQSAKFMLAYFESLLEEFKTNQEHFEINISKQFDEIRFKIDLQREELKKKIDEIALEMIDQTKEREKTLLKDLNRASSNILNTGLDEEGRRLLEEFRNPNMVVASLKASIEKHELSIRKLEKNIEHFNLQVDQTKSFYFTPNLSNAKQIFGALNLSYVIRKLISGSDDKTIKIWDLETFKCSTTLNGHSGEIRCLETLSNKRFLSTSEDRSIKLWNLETGLCIKTFNHDTGVGSLRILSDSTFASGSYGQIKIWNINDGNCTKTLIGHTDYVKDIILTPDGSLVSCSQDKTIKVWNIERGVCTKTLNGHTSHVLRLLLLKNGALVSGAGDKTIKIWLLESGTCITTLIGHNDKIWSLELKQSGELISASDDRTIKIWNLETCTCVKTLVGHNGSITSIKLLKDNFLMSGSVDKTIKFWNLENGACIRTLTGHTSVVQSLTIA